MERHSPSSPTNDGRLLSPARKGARRPRILIFNFFEGILKRGIPIYADDLSTVLEKWGIECVPIRCPKILKGLPRPLLHILFIAMEQIVVPFAGLRCDAVIYPYNSIAIAARLHRKSALVVHDFILSRAKNRSVAALYIRVTQNAYALCGGRVIYISRSTERIGKLLGQFPRSATYLFPNSFYKFMELASKTPRVRGDGVLLCSGWGGNKDLAGALRLYLESGLYRSRPLRILGLAGRRGVVDGFEQEHPEVAGRIHVMAQVDDMEVVEAYEQAAWVWVHSMAEGYGRSIAEARICGSKVVASNIPPFREQKDEATFLYRGLAEFERAIAACEAMNAPAQRRIPQEHEILCSEIQRFMSAHE